MVPVMVNTYYPPNQPTPKRCYAFGQAVRKAIESWDSTKRVALLASGGLSHVVIDEEIDAMVIDGLKNKKPEVLFQLPRQKLTGGTSEILNWVALAGAMERSRSEISSNMSRPIARRRRPAAAWGSPTGSKRWFKFQVQKFKVKSDSRR